MKVPFYQREGAIKPFIGSSNNLLVFFTIILFACCSSPKYGRIDKGPQFIKVIVRSLQSNNLIEGAEVELCKDDCAMLGKLTNKLGYTEFYCNPDLRNQISNLSLTVRDTFNGTPVSSTVGLNPFISLYEIYLDEPGLGFGIDSNKIADMHIQTTMRVQNLFGHPLHSSRLYKVPPGLNWYKDYSHLAVSYKKRWQRGYLGSINFNGKYVNLRKEALMSALLDPEKTISSGNTNKLIHYTQATIPHLLEGRLMLSYNPICPFEFNVASDLGRRLVNNALASGASLPWLERVGGKYHLTHWENFKLEFEMLKVFSHSDQGYEWEFYKIPSQLSGIKPLVVNYVEGSHVLQDKFFPHFINYNMEARSLAQSKDLLEKTLTTIAGPSEEKQLKYLDEYFKADIIGSSFNDYMEFIGYAKLDSFIDSILIDEIIGNIQYLKTLNPKIWIMTISHLTYNGMTGHAPSLDQGKFPNRMMASKSYGLRVSDDISFKKHWEKTFFTIPGVNKFGRVMIDSLLSTTNGHRILIDLKHSDAVTRGFFFDSIMIQPCCPSVGDRVPPVCTHCPVTGLPLPYYSPLVDEFSLTHSPLSTTFYPFGINLYNEEIEKICQNNGIIGIPLEQRALGGYLNRRILRDTFINRQGDIKFKKNTIPRKQLIRRWPYNERWIKHYLKNHRYLVIPQKSIESQLASYFTSIDDKTGTRLFIKDYLSAEPFLRNLFHIIDHSGYPNPRDSWRHICLGSDLDGIIDPIDICPTASHYPIFKGKLKVFIPIFLQLRRSIDPKANYRNITDYFNNEGEINRLLDFLFYDSLEGFTKTYLK